MNAGLAVLAPDLYLILYQVGGQRSHPTNLQGRTQRVCCFELIYPMKTREGIGKQEGLIL